jgi:hypothetical protein
MIFSQVWLLISPPSDNEIQIYLYGVEEGHFFL